MIETAVEIIGLHKSFGSTHVLRGIDLRVDRGAVVCVIGPSGSGKSTLDPELVGDVLDVMRGLASGGMTMLVVTHEIQFAREVADRVLFLDGGVVVEQGPPAEVIGNPREARTREFLARVRHNAT